MDKAEERDPGLRALGLVFGTVALWGGSFALAARILHHHSLSVRWRAAAVIIAVVGFIPWPLATAKLIRMHDEFTRRVHLIALAIAFAATGLFIFLADMLRRADFIGYISLMTIWLVMMGIWWFAIMATEWYYRR